MKDYVILTDSCCDLDKEKREEFGIDYVAMQISYDGGSFSASLDWETFSPKQYYDMIRAGIQFKSSQVSSEVYFQKFEECIRAGKDVLSLSCSSGLSDTVNSSIMAKKDILKKYPDAKIICIDCLRSSLGLGLLVLRAAEMRNGGRGIDEVADWVEKNRVMMNQIGTVSDLVYLKRVGRVTGTVALRGDVFRIKPLLICNRQGQNVAVGKAIGRKTSVRKCINYTKEHIIDPENQIVGLAHADCLEEAKKIKSILTEELDCEVYMNYVDPAVGASVGPDTIGIYFFGHEITK